MAPMMLNQLMPTSTFPTSNIPAQSAASQSDFSRIIRPFKTAEKLTGVLVIINVLYHLAHLILEARNHFGGPDELYQAGATVLTVMTLVAIVIVLAHRLGWIASQKAEMQAKLLKAEQDLVAEKAKRTAESQGRNEANRIARLSEIFHDINHCVRDLTSEPLATKGGAHVARAAQIYVNLCDLVGAAFSEIYCASPQTFRVTLKAFVTHHAVVTIARNSASLALLDSEHDANRDWSISKQTAFRRLYFADQVCYACDDLPEATKHGYQNSSEKWEDRYTAAMVGPIRKKLSGAAEGLYDLVGYLAVDARPALPTPIFCDARNEPCKEQQNFLLGVADGLFAAIKRGVIVSPKASETGYVNDPSIFPYVRQLNLAYLDLVRQRHAKPAPKISQIG
jgi:hypothetical protein